MVTERLLDVSTRVIMAAAPPWLRQMDRERKGRSLRERRLDTYSLSAAWCAIAGLDILLLFAIGLPYNLVTGHRLSNPLIILITAPAFLGAIGMILQYVRSQRIRVFLRIGMAYSVEYNRLVRPLVVPNDGDLIVQGICTAIIVALEFRFGVL